MTITPVQTIKAADTGTTGTTTGSTSTSTSALPQQTLGQNDFLKLLSVQFQQQDPLKPTDDTAFIAQMAQFTSLAQTSSINTQVTSLNSSQQNAAASNLLGRDVTIKNSDGTSISGVVSSVDISGSTPQLTVNGLAYPLTSVVTVQTADPSATPVTTTPSATTPADPTATAVTAVSTH